MSTGKNFCTECNIHVSLVEGANGLECSKCQTVIVPKKEPWKKSVFVRHRRTRPSVEAVKGFAAAAREAIARATAPSDNDGFIR